MNLEPLLKEALAFYPLANPAAALIRHNENATWHVTDGMDKSYVLRVHQSRAGFSQSLFSMDKEPALRGELRILTALNAHSGIPVQIPVKNREGETLSKLSGGEFATLLTWLEGSTLENAEATPELLHGVGRMTACMHRCFQTCSGLPASAGHDYDKALMDRMIGKFEDMERAGIISPNYVRGMTACLLEIKCRMAQLDRKDQSFGVVHSDLSKSNMLLCDGTVVPIDFGLWGYGYYYMDLGALASHYEEAWQQNAIFEGYESVSHFHVERRYVEPFICLGILLFLCAFGESVYKEEWFPGALERWTNTYFLAILGK
jgi:Ser/Thr protein kinase RdoA (MazF antagonist)